MKGLATQFPKGVSGNPGGRPKRLMKRMDEQLRDKNLSPLVELLALLPDLSPKDQSNIWLELLSYCLAKPKQEDLLDENNRPLKNVSTKEIILNIIRDNPKLLEEIK